MGDELANLLKIFKRVEKDGRQATLSVSTNAGKTTVKLELTSSLSKPAPSLPSSSASGGRRCRHRGPAKKEKAKVRAALHKPGYLGLYDCLSRCCSPRPSSSSTTSSSQSSY